MALTSMPLRPSALVNMLGLRALRLLWAQLLKTVIVLLENHFRASTPTCERVPSDRSASGDASLLGFSNNMRRCIKSLALEAGLW